MNEGSKFIFDELELNKIRQDALERFNQLYEPSFNKLREEYPDQVGTIAMVEEGKRDGYVAGYTAGARMAFSLVADAQVESPNGKEE